MTIKEIPSRHNNQAGAIAGALVKARRNHSEIDIRRVGSCQAGDVELHTRLFGFVWHLRVGSRGEINGSKICSGCDNERVLP